MKIIKHGSKSSKKPKEKFEDFKCEKCGCEFSVKEDEYYNHEGGGNCFYGGSLTVSSTYTYTWPPKDRLICSCPECYKICTKIISKSDYCATYPVTVANSNISKAILDNKIGSDSLSNYADANKILLTSDSADLKAVTNS